MKKKYRNNAKSSTFPPFRVCPDVSPKTMGLLIRLYLFLAIL